MIFNAIQQGNKFRRSLLGSYNFLVDVVHYESIVDRILIRSPGRGSYHFTWSNRVNTWYRSCFICKGKMFYLKTRVIPDCCRDRSCVDDFAMIRSFVTDCKLLSNAEWVCFRKKDKCAPVFFKSAPVFFTSAPFFYKRPRIFFPAFLSSIIYAKKLISSVFEVNCYVL